MIAFKTSIQRKYFIDKKIKENSYPSAVSLAHEYTQEYHKKVDPRTIATDISELRERYNAPISYDSQKKGYFYSDESFHLNLLVDDNSGIPLDNLFPNLYSKTAFVPNWQKNLLLAFTQNILPHARQNPGEKSEVDNQKISIIPCRTDTPEKTATETMLLEAVNTSKTMKITAENTKNIVDEFDFKPLHVICEGKEVFFFGKKIADKTHDSFIVLNSEIIRSATQAMSESNPANVNTQKPENHSYYVQTIAQYDLEILISDNDKDSVFIFSCEKSYNAHTPTQYELIAKLDVFV